MAAVPSTMLPLGTLAPDFDLPDMNGPRGARLALRDLPRQPLVVMFICNHCPFVKHIRAELARFGRDYAGTARIVAISSNDAEHYPDDAPDRMREEASSAGYSFPYLYDESQAIAKAYRAACTPDFYVFDAARRLVYRGQLDDARPKNGLAVNGADLRAALDAAIAGRPAPATQKPSIGCNIKWKAGNEPEYAR